MKNSKTKVTPAEATLFTLNYLEPKCADVTVLVPDATVVDCTSLYFQPNFKMSVMQVTTLCYNELQ